MTKIAIEHTIRGRVADFKTQLAALGYAFGAATVTFKDGDLTKTRADVQYIDDLAGDGPHQRLQFWGPRASRDAAALENVYNSRPAVDAPLIGQDAGLQVRRLSLPPTVADNALPNIDMTGAVDDTPGPDSLPTGWSDGGFGPAVTVVAVDTTSSPETIDLRFQGTGNGSSRSIWLSAIADIAAAQDEQWRWDIQLALVGGDLTGINLVSLRFNEYRADETETSFSETVDIKDQLGATLQTFAAERVVPTADAAHVRTRLELFWANGPAVDCTIRVALPLLAKTTLSLYQRRPAFLGYRTETMMSGLPSLTSGVVLRGFNLAGPDFAGGTQPGVHGSDYIYPVSAYAGADYQGAEDMVAKGYNCVRLPFRWARLQRALQAAFDTAEQTRLVATVNHLTGLGAYCIVNPHDFGGYGEAKLNQTNVTGTIASNPAPTTNTAVLSGVGISVLDDWYNGLTISIDGNDYTINDYAGATKTITVSGTFAPALTGGEAFTVATCGAVVTVKASPPVSAGMNVLPTVIVLVAPA